MPELKNEDKLIFNSTDENGELTITISETQVVIVQGDSHEFRDLTAVEKLLWDAMKKAESKQIKCNPNEPYFVLLGRDPQAPSIVNYWANVRRECEPDSPKVQSAKAIVDSMIAYKQENPDIGMSVESIKKYLFRK